MSDTRILIVEDEEITALDIEVTLNQLGYQVVGVVPSGEEAITQAFHLLPDLVLMDIQLRGELDGIQATEAIQAQSSIPVVYLTAHADIATLQRAKATEPFGYVLKPFEERTLHTTVEIALYRHRAEQRMQAAIDREKHLQVLRSNFIAAASHEFRTPLSTILLATESLEYYSQNVMDEKKQKRFQLIKNSVAHMTQLLDEVLVFEKAEAHKLTFQPAMLNLVEFCVELTEEMQLDPNSRIRFTSSASTIMALADENLLRHALSNLLSNALKYSSQGSIIFFDLQETETSYIFQVRDTGIGIPADELPYLFEAFQRASNVGKIPGTGLGLAIAKQCITLHGGEIAIESSPDLGTISTVTLPIASL